MHYSTIARQSFLALLFFALCASIPAAAQANRDGAKPDDALRRELIKMGNEDQKHRNEIVTLMWQLSKPDSKRALAKFTALTKKQDTIDKKNLKRLEEIIERHGWPTKSMVGAEASENAFLIIQHADLTRQKKYFPLLKAAAARNEARPDHAAMMEDRILMGEGKKQIYGTGLHTNDVSKALELWPIENEEEVDARRAAVGLPPMAEFLKAVGLKYTPPKKNN